MPNWYLRWYSLKFMCRVLQCNYPWICW